MKKYEQFEINSPNIKPAKANVKQIIST